MKTEMTTNEINFRVTSAIGYCYGINNQAFINYHQITKCALALEDLYTRAELIDLCQTDNIENLHEAILAIIN